jgi:anti-sigma-K factor RskA
MGRAFAAGRRADRNARATPVPPPRRPWAAWPLAAAAGFAAAWLLLAPAAPAAPARLREQLAAIGGTQVAAWAPGASAAHGRVAGDVVWNAARQEGWLRIAGLERLPDDRQYQLWIVDAARTGAPVDGGLFDLAGRGEHVVPVRARLPVGRAAAFVVTVEPRGGVVVSEQKDVVAVAKP